MSILVNADNAIPIIIVATTGEVIGEIVLYYLAKRGSELLLKKEKKKEIEVKKFIHKYSWVIFIFAPFIPIGTDAIVIFAGIKHVKIFHFILPMSVGFALKNIVTVVLALQGSALLSEIFTLCGVS